MVLYDFIYIFYMILHDFWGCGRNFRMTRFSEFERFSGFSTFDRKFEVPPKFSNYPFFFTISYVLFFPDVMSFGDESQSQSP